MADRRVTSLPARNDAMPSWREEVSEILNTEVMPRLDAALTLEGRDQWWATTRLLVDAQDALEKGASILRSGAGCDYMSVAVGAQALVLGALHQPDAPLSVPDLLRPAEQALDHIVNITASLPIDCSTPPLTDASPQTAASASSMDAGQRTWRRRVKAALDDVHLLLEDACEIRSLDESENGAKLREVLWIARDRIDEGASLLCAADSTEYYGQCFRVVQSLIVAGRDLTNTAVGARAILDHACALLEEIDAVLTDAERAELGDAVHA